ncbi:hypothetical protein DESUT3_37020 [Desulfuromonas versatilis]|uniref:Magnesium transporter MgtE intracellular domain-containing protein n=1 Tax=Desulfuromonas versatilis TaxID=2802975 RepID=A0ABM8I102_9BACT|nr:hypothetical protein [Desulfuromonas versatilis]BCR06633.1 hypothetical protein DESUT3_37020 [Desulfuromonas versatilis]
MKNWPRLKRAALGACLLLVLGSTTAWGQQQAPGENQQFGSVEERRIRYSLQQERARLQAEYAKKEEMLALREIELKSLQAEVDKKLDELRNMRQELEKQLAQKDEIETRRIKQLSRMYEKMEPAQAAGLMSELDQDLAVQILSGMKAKAAGRLLDAMDQDKATSLSAAYSELGAR